MTDEKKLLVANIEKVGETGNPVRWLDWFDCGALVFGGISVEAVPEKVLEVLGQTSD